MDFVAADFVPPESQIQGKDVLFFPSVISFLVPVFNLPGLTDIGSSLILSRETLLGIFNGMYVRESILLLIDIIISRYDSIRFLIIPLLVRDRSKQTTS